MLKFRSFIFSAIVGSRVVRFPPPGWRRQPLSWMRPLLVGAALAGHVGSGPVVLWRESSVLHGLVLKFLAGGLGLRCVVAVRGGRWSVGPAWDMSRRFHFVFSKGSLFRGKVPLINVRSGVALDIYIRLDCCWESADVVRPRRRTPPALFHDPSRCVVATLRSGLATLLGFLDGEDLRWLFLSVQPVVGKSQRREFVRCGSRSFVAGQSRSPGKPRPHSARSVGGASSDASGRTHRLV